MTKTFKFSLMFEIAIFCLILVLFSSFAIQFYANKSTEKAVEDTMGQSALNITRSVVNNIDADKFNTLINPEDMQDIYYKELRQELNSIRETTGLKYIYTMRKTEDNKYIYVVDGTPIDDEEASLLGSEETEMSDLMISSMSGQEGYELSESEEWGYLTSAYVPIKDSSGQTIGMLGADFEAEYIMNQLENTKENMKVIAAVIALIGIILSTIFSYLIVRSLKQLQSKMKLVEQGDLTVNVKNKRIDEVGRLSEAFQSVLDNTSFIISNIRSNTDEIVNNVNQLNVGINESNKTMGDITNAVNDIASGTQVQVGSIDNVSNSMEKVFEEIQSITKNAELLTDNSNIALKDTKEAAKILKDSVKQINLVNDTVDDTAFIMKELQVKFQEILSFSDRVSAIASQTNLLSINASIEAALAGKAGKGFAVVADEIKKLALETSNDSKNINEIINKWQVEITSSTDAIENGVIQSKEAVEIIMQVDKLLEGLLNSNKLVDTKVKEVSNAIMNIEKDSNYVLENINQLSDISTEFSSNAQNSAAATEEQLSIMKEFKMTLGNVKEMVERLNMAVSKFKIE